MREVFCGLFAAIIVFAMTTAADAGTFNYQGFLTDNASGNPVDAPSGKNMRFSIYLTSSGGTAQWTEVHTGVVINQGIYSVELGSVNPFPSSLTFAVPYYLQVEIEDGLGGWELFGTRQKLTSVPSSIYSENADRVDGMDASSFITSETDPTVDPSVKDGVDWSELTGIPLGFSDGTDDGITTEADPTVADSVKDGVSWDEVTGKPAGFADGVDDVGLTSETDPQVGSVSLNYVPKWNGNALVTGSIYDSGTHIGIGTNVPSDKLHVLGGNIRIDDPYPMLRFYNGSTYKGFIQAYGTDFYISNQLSGDMFFRTAGNTRMTIDSSGNVGIGLSSPSSRLDVEATASNFAVKGTNSTYGPWGYLGGPVYGVGGFSSGSGVGVYGNNSTSGNYGTLGGDTAGVKGYSASGGQYGVYGIHLAPSNDTPAVYGKHAVTDFFGIGVKGEGLYRGVEGRVSATGTKTYTGVYGTAYTSGGGGTTRGVYGSASGGTTNYGGYFVGTGAGSSGVGIYASGGDYAGIFAGKYIKVNGAGGEEAYIGGDGAGNDVQIGSANASITSVALWNSASGKRMDLYLGALHVMGGADLAEPFDVSDPDNIRPGMLVAIDPDNPGQLKIADRAYDKAVAGIISGAKGINPGLTMRQEGTEAQGQFPVALTGRVYAWADASYGAIEPGDMLTTSNTPGHAMKVSDYEKAHGTIIGKAMTSLKKGKGLVLVLVTLQ
jgi:hypothetical protein